MPHQVVIVCGGFDVPGGRVLLRDGEKIPYDTLVLAAGSETNYLGMTSGATRRNAMQERLDYKKFPGIEPMIGLEKYIHGCGLERKLLELVKLRASQINGCAYCIDMHTKDARAANESEQRLYAVSVWQETPFFTDREQAALAWTEALTLLPQFHVSDQLYERVRRQFNEKELVDLTMAIVAINGWNRLAKTFRTVPGTYQPGTGSQEKKQTTAPVYPMSETTPGHPSLTSERGSKG